MVSNKAVAVSALIGVHAAVAAAQDPLQDGACARPDEVEACSSGKENRWFYSIIWAPGIAKNQKSWGYATRELAQRGLDRDKRLCQLLDQYYERTDCRTLYGGVFCDACGTPNTLIRLARRLTSKLGASDWETSAKRAYEAWEKDVERAFRRFGRTRTARSPLSEAAVGRALRRYADEVKEGVRRARELADLYEQRRDFAMIPARGSRRRRESLEASETDSMSLSR
jgi:hypothetical protein